MTAPAFFPILDLNGFWERNRCFYILGVGWLLEKEKALKNQRLKYVYLLA